MHTIPTLHSAALPQPWDQKSEATTSNNRFNDDHATNDHTTTSMTAAVSALNANQNTTSAPPMNQDPPVKRHCSASLWNTRHIQHHQQLLMTLQQQHNQKQNCAHLQSSVRKRDYQGDPQQTSLELMKHASSVERIVKKSRLEASSLVMACDDLSETIMLMQQGEASSSSPLTQDAEEVWNFIGIG